MKIREASSSDHETMRALIQRSDRGPQDLGLSASQRRPTPGAEDYLVRVSAAGVNFADVMQTSGTYADGPSAPYVAGFEAAGEIVGIGEKVTRPFSPGTHVIGAGRGAFAQYMVMPAAGALPVPAGWSDANSLGMVLNWATALAALRPLGEIKPGEVVLITAAAGGVGQAAVRLAKHYGARIIATASPSKHDILHALGADIVLDGRHPDLAEEIIRRAQGVDLVLESVGKATFNASLTVTKPFTGRVIVLGAASGDASLTTGDLIFTHRVQIKGLHIAAMAATAPAMYKALLDELEDLISSGVYAPGNPEIHPLAEGAALLERLASGQTHGKHALDPWL